jgi:predicted transcriptional regulator
MEMETITIERAVRRTRRRVIGQDTKRIIVFSIIDKNPGIRYRELLRLTGFNNGTLTHHLGILEKIKAIQVYRKNNKILFCEDFN